MIHSFPSRNLCEASMGTATRHRDPVKDTKGKAPALPGLTPRSVEGTAAKGRTRATSASAGGSEGRRPARCRVTRRLGGACSREGKARRRVGRWWFTIILLPASQRLCRPVPRQCGPCSRCSARASTGRKRGPVTASSRRCASSQGGGNEG